MTITCTRTKHRVCTCRRGDGTGVLRAACGQLRPDASDRESGFDRTRPVGGGNGVRCWECRENAQGGWICEDCGARKTGSETWGDLP